MTFKDDIREKCSGGCGATEVCGDWVVSWTCPNCDRH